MLGLLTASPAPTLAQSPPQPTEAEQGEAAQQHFRLGEAHYESGEFADAAREFEASYAADPRPRLLYNAYLAYRDLQDRANAARTLREYLVEVPDIEGSERGQLRRRLEALEAALAQDSATHADAADPDAALADSPPLPVEESIDTSTSDGGLSPVGFVVAGAGLALGIGAIITGVLSRSDHNLLADQCDNGSCPDTPELRDAQSRGSTLAVTTDVLWITGTAALVAGVVLIVVLKDDPSESSTGVSGSCTMDGCFGAVRGSF